MTAVLVVEKATTRTDYQAQLYAAHAAQGAFP